MRGGQEMTNAECERRIAKIFDRYDERRNRINKKYEIRWRNAMTASEVLSVNEWHDRELERLSQWYRKSLKKLNDDTKREGVV